jgi:hypothetical protein
VIRVIKSAASGVAKILSNECDRVTQVVAYVHLGVNRDG